MEQCRQIFSLSQDGEIRMSCAGCTCWWRTGRPRRCARRRALQPAWPGRTGRHDRGCSPSLPGWRAGNVERTYKIFGMKNARYFTVCLQWRI